MIRSQIYLTKDLKQFLKDISEQTKVSQSELIRSALDAYITPLKDTLNPKTANNNRNLEKSG